MKISKLIITVTIFSILAVSTFIVYKNGKCEMFSVNQDELVGVYLMNYKEFVDTLQIRKNYTFYHSSHNLKIGTSYLREGIWHTTVDGYFELFNYSSAIKNNSWDMKPYKCKEGGAIYIDNSYDGEEKYKRIQ